MNNDVDGQQVFEVDNPVLFSVQKYQRNTQCLGKTNPCHKRHFLVNPNLAGVNVRAHSLRLTTFNECPSTELCEMFGLNIKLVYTTI